METLELCIYVLLGFLILISFINFIVGDKSHISYQLSKLNLILTIVASIVIVSFLVCSTSLYDNGQRDALIGKQKYEIEFTYEKIDTVLMIEDESIFITPRDTFFDISFSPKDTSYFIIKDTIFKLKEENNVKNN